MSYLYYDMFSTELHTAIQKCDFCLEDKKSVGKITMKRNIVTKEILIFAVAVGYAVPEQEFLELLKRNREYNKELYNLVFVEYVEDLI